MDWNAADILVRLSKISPHFLPRPLGLMTEQADGTKHFNGTKKKLNHDILIEIYKLTGSYLHIANPYKLNAINLEKKKKETVREILKKEVTYLKSVIWEHVKIGLTWKADSDPTVLKKSESAWLVSFGNKDSDQVTMALASAIKAT